MILLIPSSVVLMAFAIFNFCTLMTVLFRITADSYLSSTNDLVSFLYLYSGWLLGRAHRSLRAETGGRKGPVGSRLRQIQPLAHLDDLESFAARL